MKKIFSLAAATALMMAFAACDEVQESNAVPQTNPQEAIFKTSDLNVTANNGVIDLEACDKAGTTATIGDAIATYWPEAYHLRMVCQLAANDAFTDAIDFTTTTTVVDGTNNYTITAPTNLVNAAYRQAVTKDPSQGKAWVRFVPYASSEDGKANVRLGGPDFYYGPYEVTIQPIAPTQIIENQYVLLVSESADLSNPTKYDLTNSGANPYVDPNFETVIDNNDGKTLYWAVTTLAGSPIYGVPASEVDEANGTLLEGSTDYNSFSYMANVKVAVNMEDLTWKAFAAIEKFYMPTYRRYLQSTAQCVYTTNYRFYQGVGNLNRDFMFDPTTTWSDKNELGLAPDTEVKADYNAETGETTYSGSCALSTNDYIPVDFNGLNYVTLDYTALTFTILPVKSIGVIGGFNNWAGDVTMTPNSNNLIWTSDAFKMTANDEFKFRFNGAWNVDLGGSLDDLQFKGSNIVCPETGTYIITINFTAHPYVATLTKQ